MRPPFPPQEVGRDMNIMFPGNGDTPVADLLLADRLSLAARQSVRMNCVRLGLQRAAEKRIINQDFSNAIVRQIRPTFDLAWGVNANQSWYSGANVAGVATVLVNNTQIPVNRMFVFYGVQLFDAQPGWTELTVQRGTTGSGGLLMISNLQTLYNALEPEGYFSKSILYDPQDIMYVTAMPYITNALGSGLVLLGYSIEPIGLVYPASLT